MLEHDLQGLKIEMLTFHPYGLITFLQVQLSLRLDFSGSGLRAKINPVHISSTKRIIQTKAWSWELCQRGSWIQTRYLKAFGSGLFMTDILS